MYKNKNILAVVPARGGSKGIKLKNLRKIDGLSLVAHVGKTLKDIPYIDTSVVSTDHHDIAEEAKAHGIDAPFFRPEELSGDRIGDWDVLSHALKASEAHYSTRFDLVVMLQPTSPLRLPEHVSGAIEMLVKEEFDSIWSVSETDSKGHPFKQLIIDNNKMTYWDERGGNIVARQQLTPVYHRNGIVYVITRECMLEQKTIKGKNAGAYLVEGNHVSIDTEWDLELVNYIMSKGL